MAYAVAENGRSYDEGVAAGEITQRLKEHDQHLNKINGSMGKIAGELGGVKMQLQRMNDSMEADRATVITTAAALKNAKEASEQRWSPATRIFAILGALAAVVSVVSYLVINHG